ncbi:MAG: endonuclease/exonuclease/phosphatase family protein [Candidatus Bathyarchaeia archaeon]
MMLSLKKWVILVIILSAFVSFLLYPGMLKEDVPDTDNGDATPPIFNVTDSIQVAAFNIQIFGRSKRSKEEVMDVLSRIVREFDVVLVQEIRDASGETAPEFLEIINQREGNAYAYIESPRLGRTISKESYAYFYNTRRVNYSFSFVYNDTSDVFEREPYIATFMSGNFDFTLVGIHTKPDDAYNEIGNLTLVVSSLLNGERDIIVLGDLNADGRYFDEEDTTNPLKAEEYYWVISNDMDTMTRTDWTYDRIILLNSTYGHEYVSSGVFHFDKAYNITDEEFVWDVSDHFPVYAEFNTVLSDDDPS